MKRVLPILIILTLLEVIGMVYLGKFILFDDYVVELPNGTIIDTYVYSDLEAEVRFTVGHHKYVKRGLTERSGECLVNGMKRTRRYVTNFGAEYPVVIFLYLLFGGYFIAFTVCKFVDLDCCYWVHRRRGERFVVSDNDINIINSTMRCKIYNAIDECDFTPMKDAWLVFWGYK